MIREPGASGPQRAAPRKGIGPFRRGGDVLLLMVSWYLLFLFVIFDFGNDISSIAFIEKLGLGPLVGRYLVPGWDSSRILFGYAALVLCLAACLVGGATALAYDRLVKPRVRSDLDFGDINRRALGFMNSNRSFSVLWCLALIAASIFPFALGFPINYEAPDPSQPLGTAKLFLTPIIKYAAIEFCVAAAAAFFCSKHVHGKTRPGDVAARAGVGCLVGGAFFSLGMVAMFVAGGVMVISQETTHPVYPAWIIVPSTLYAFFVEVLLVMTVIRHNQPHRAFISAIRIFVTDFHALVRFLWSGLGRAGLYVFPLFLIWSWTVFYLPDYIGPGSRIPGGIAGPGILLGSLERLAAANHWLVQEHGVNLVFAFLFAPVTLWFTLAVTHAVWSIDYARWLKRERFHAAPAPAPSPAAVTAPALAPEPVAGTRAEQEKKKLEEVNWVAALEVSAGIFLLVGIPIFYGAMLWWDNATFRKPFGEHHWQFFYALATVAGENDPATVNFYGQPRQCATRQQVRDALTGTGAIMEDYDGQERGKYRDYFYWDRSAQRFGLVVDYDLIPDGVYFCSGWMRDVNSFRPAVAWLGLAWMLTALVLGLRLRPFLSARPDADRWLKPWRRLKTARAVPLAGAERKWKYSKIILVPVLFLVWAYCGYTLYASVQAYKCAVARRLVFEARSQYMKRWGDEPALPEFIAHYDQYRQRERERCGESMEAVCKKDGVWDENCLAGCTVLPASLERVTCPSGGKWYLGDEDHVYCTVHPE